MRKSLQGAGQEIKDLSWTSIPVAVEACGASVPCALSFQCFGYGNEVFFQLSLQVALQASLFPTTSSTGDVQKALVIYLFSSTLGTERIKSPRCVSSDGCDGHCALLVGFAEQRTNTIGIDFKRSRDCKWVDELLVRGEVQALGVVDCLCFVT